MFRSLCVFRSSSCISRLRVFRATSFAGEYANFFLNIKGCGTASVPELDCVFNRIENALTRNKVSANHDNLKHIVSFLLKCEALPDVLENKFVESPKVSNVGFAHWNRIVNTLMDYGFTISQAVDIIFKVPVVLGLSRERILNILDTIQIIGMTSEEILIAVSNHPHLLTLNVPFVQRRMLWLKNVFPKKDLIKICKKNPAILCYSEEELEDKLQYMVTRMGLEQPQMIKSNVWSHSLNRLQIRHELLERLGLYKRPNPKNKEMNKNPSLNKILDTADLHFANKIAQVSLEEYELFCKLATTEGFLKEWDTRNDDTSDDEEFSE